MSKYTLSEHLQQIECSRHAIDQAEQMESEIDRLTRELAEAKAQAVIPDGWVAVGWLSEFVWESGTGYSFSYKEPKPIPHEPGLISQRTSPAYMLSARPEYPPNGLPKESRK